MKLSRKAATIVVIFLLIFIFLPLLSFREGFNEYFSFNSAALAAQSLDEEEPFAEEPFAAEHEVVADPLETLNRGFFHFNDKLYFWFLKPVSRVYAGFIPEGLRIGIRNAFDNLLFPIRVVNNSFQGKFKEAGGELARFVVNSTIGFVGMVDVANRDFGLPPHNEDFGQTLGFYGMKPVVYLHWPFFGPSSLRDSVGLAVDAPLSPFFWISTADVLAGVAVRTGFVINNTSLIIGEYEDLKKAALDPYIAFRDAYLQNRAKEIKR